MMNPPLILVSPKLSAETTYGREPGGSFSSVSVHPPKSLAACWRSTPVCCKNPDKVHHSCWSVPANRPMGQSGYGGGTAKVLRAICVASSLGPGQNQLARDVRQKSYRDAHPLSLPNFGIEVKVGSQEESERPSPLWPL